MQREIKFRGKRLDNGEWVYGCLCCIDNEPVIVEGSMKWVDGSELYCNTFHFVIPESDGQYTGILDKNDIEIYEGDILKDTDNEIYYVDFIRGCFYLRTNYKSFPHLGWAEWLPMCEIDRLANPTEFEVIGNIYENPELLEVQHE